VVSHLCLESASGSKVLKDSGIGFLCFEDARINGTSFLLAHTLNIFAFLVIEFFRLNTFTVNLGDCICIRIQTAVAINTDKDKCRNNQNHGDKHQPTFLVSKRLEHYDPQALSERFLLEYKTKV